MFYSKEKFSTRIFRSRGFYVGEGLLNNGVIANKRIAKLVNKRLEEDKILL
jgi:hypothetical protein